LFDQVIIIKASFQDYILQGYDAASLGNFKAMPYPHVRGPKCILGHFHLCLRISGSGLWSIIFQKNRLLSYTAAEISKLTNIFFKLFSNVFGEVRWG
jgi:hypothetical protein